MLWCVRVCACVCARVCVCACVCMSARARGRWLSGQPQQHKPGITMPARPRLCHAIPAVLQGWLQPWCKGGSSCAVRFQLWCKGGSSCAVWFQPRRKGATYLGRGGLVGEGGGRGGKGPALRRDGSKPT